jgi:hypothetical protein
MGSACVYPGAKRPRQNAEILSFAQNDERVGDGGVWWC